jgi:hypothetical protein
LAEAAARVHAADLALCLSVLVGEAGSGGGEGGESWD